MNAFALMEAFGDLSEADIARELAYQPQKKAGAAASIAEKDAVPAEPAAETVQRLPVRLLRWGTLAACLTLTAGFVYLLASISRAPDSMSSQVSESEQTTASVSGMTAAVPAGTTTTLLTTAAPAATGTTASGQGSAPESAAADAQQAQDPDAADTTERTGTTATTTGTTAVRNEEPKKSENGLMIDGVFYQKGDFNMDGAIDLRDVYEMSALYWEMLLGSSRARTMRSEQLELGDIVDWAPMVTEHTGLDQTYLLPYDTNDTGMLRRYVCVQHMDSSVTLEAFVQLSDKEINSLMSEFNRQYKTVNVIVAEGNEVSDGEIVPLEAADGLYDHFGGTYYLCGDINMNGELDEEDAGLAEQIYASRGDDFSLVQRLLANITRTVCRNSSENYVYHATEYLQITGAEKAQLIRDYIRLRDMGIALPESLYEFYEQREAGAYDAQLKQ